MISEPELDGVERDGAELEGVGVKVDELEGAVEGAVELEAGTVELPGTVGGTSLVELPLGPSELEFVWVVELAVSDEAVGLGTIEVTPSLLGMEEDSFAEHAARAQRAAKTRRGRCLNMAAKAGGTDFPTRQLNSAT